MSKYKNYVLLVCGMLFTAAIQAQPYVPSTLKVWGYPLLIPVAKYDKQTGALLHGRTVAIASRPEFGHVRYTEDGYLAYFPISRPLIPDSFVYSINDSEGYSVKVKVMIDPQEEPILVHHHRWDGHRW